MNVIRLLILLITKCIFEQVFDAFVDLDGFDILDALSCLIAFKGIDLSPRNMAMLFGFAGLHIGIGLAEELCCLEFFGLMTIQASAMADFCLEKITTHLTVNPTCRIATANGGWNQIFDILV